jgi:glycogen synthase
MTPPKALRIALVGYEYVGYAISGGIGTYMRNLAGMMAARGHDVEVFAGGDHDAQLREGAGVTVNLIGIKDRRDFPEAVAPVFLDRHAARKFDVIEGAEFYSETAGISKAAPLIPLVLKLHMPSSMLLSLGHHFIPFSGKARFILGGVLRGKWNKPYWTYRAGEDPERLNLLLADEVTAPCRAIADAVSSIWDLNVKDIAIIPNVFIASRNLLSIPGDTSTGTITFIGRLEMRKGVFDLAEAIPLVLREFAEAKFRFVGRSLNHPASGKDIRSLLQSRLKAFGNSVEFIEGVPHDAVHQFYASSDICVFPSVWENFPNVCLEAMSAARGVVGSSAGGMAEIIEHERTGLLVPPRNPRAIARAILQMLRDPAQRIRMGLAARDHVMHAYAPNVIAPMQEASYHRAISRSLTRTAKCPRELTTL